MKKTIAFICLLLLTTCVMAQDGITLHFMRLNPYSAYTSPSAHLQYKGYIGFPAISNINVALTNTGIHYKTLFGTNAEGTITTIKLNNFVDKLSAKKNVLNTNVSLNIIDFGFQTKPIRFSFSYRIRIDEYFSYNKDLFALPVHGNMTYLGENNPARPDFRLNLTAYQEIALGMQFEFADRFYIGIRPKLLFGLANAKTTHANANLYTDPEDYSMKLNYKLDADMACVIPYSISMDSSGASIQFKPEEFKNNWQNAFRNVGASIDLGFTYRINNSFGVSASVLDLGFIHWKTNCNHIQSTIASSETSTHYNDGSFIFNGLSEDEIQQISDNPNAFTEEMLKYFPVNIEEKKGYTKALTSRFLVEGYFNLGKYHRFSALFQGRIINRQFQPSFTLAWNGNFLNIFDLCVSYTIAKRSYSNLGVGVGFNLGVFHMYAVTDNIFGFINSKSPQRAILNAHNANAQIGIVFDWGKIQEKKLLDKKTLQEDSYKYRTKK